MRAIFLSLILMEVSSDPVSSTNIQGSGCSGGAKRRRRVTKKGRKGKRGKGKAKTRRNRKSKMHKRRDANLRNA